MLMNPLNQRTQFGRADAEEASRTWWIFLFAGITSIVFGVLILTIDWSVDSLGTFVGVLFILQGAWLAVTPSLDGSGRWSNLGAGVIAIAAGVALIAWPDKGLQTVGIFIGIFVLSLGPPAHRRRDLEQARAELVAHARAGARRGADRRLGDAPAGPDDRAPGHAHGSVGGRQRDLPGADGVRAQEAAAARRLARRCRPDTPCPASGRRTSRR